MVEIAEHLKTLTSPSSDRQTSAATSSEPCLSDDDILSFAQGALTSHALERAHRHIDSCATCQRLVAEAAHALDAETVPENERFSFNCVFQQNMIVGGRYRINRLIGRGGMGEVYEAYDAELQEHLALKTITATACDNPRAVRALKGEVQLARRISHGNVCRIYDFRTHVIETTGVAVHYLIMEFVDGESLGKRLRDKERLTVEEAIEIGRELLLGLRAAHQAGILHRDFKSDNVMLRIEVNGQTRPVILDFGLAKALNEHGHAASAYTQDRGMVGTLGYMAPEQIEGAPLSQATDIYAFGVVLFEMLTGRLPFTGETPAASAVARLHCAPIAPSHLNPDVPEWVDAIVHKCLGRHPEDRYGSAEEVLAAVAIGPTQPRGVAPSLPPRPRWSARVGVALLLTASVALGWRMVGQQRGAAARKSSSSVVAPTVVKIGEPLSTPKGASDNTVVVFPVNPTPSASAKARPIKAPLDRPALPSDPPREPTGESTRGRAAHSAASQREVAKVQEPEWLPP